MKQEDVIVTSSSATKSRLPSLAVAALAAPMLIASGGQASAMTYGFNETDAVQLADAAVTELIADTAELAEASEVESFSAMKSISPEDGSKDVAAPTPTGSAYSFTQLQGKGEGKVSDQLMMDAFDAGKNLVGFTFYNSVGQKSSITDIYLTGTGGLLVLPGEITAQSPGVSYSIGANPSNLPAGTTYDFYATIGADSNPPVQPNGINAVGEYVTWSFTMARGVTYNDVIKAIDSGILRVGLLVPGYSGGSASFINTCGVGGGCSQTPSVPLPASLWLMFGAIGGLAWMSRRGRKVSTST